MLSVPPNPNVTYKTHYQDEHLLVVEKPARRTTQPGLGHADDTLLNGLFARFGERLQKLGKQRDFGLLHRLDKDTSGLLVVGLSTPAYDKLRADFAARKIGKYYWAVCARAPKNYPPRTSGVIKLGIVEGFERSEQSRTNKPRLAHVRSESARGPGVKQSATVYRVLEAGEHAALLEARPITGRLHQVRVHLTAIGCAILGDPFYGPKSTKDASPRLALHAHRLTFDHPVTGERVDIKTGWPSDLRALLRRVGLKRPEQLHVP